MCGPGPGAGMKAFACDQAQRRSVHLSVLALQRTAWLGICTQTSWKHGDPHMLLSADTAITVHKMLQACMPLARLSRNLHARMDSQREVAVTRKCSPS